ncbi:MAG TPA: glycosyltransferase, partial [Ktedonobacteraceae bacterium]|nr:glycosyltransferase [Ktedonobacteraceae bacterium]
MKEIPINRSLSVVLPAHNEEEAITATVHEVIETLSTWMLDFEIIVVDDGSQDSSGEIVDTMSKTHPCLKV